VESITLPPPDRHGGCYLKLGRTLGMGCAIVGVAAYVSSSEVRIGLASVAPTPLRARRVETEIEGPEGELLPRVTQALQDLISPITDLRASEEYRRAMTVVLLERALRIARARLTVESEGSR
jgi:carbon-monoxide dehydrogenase medium subunit